MHARYYGPLLGRFLSPDRIGGAIRRPQSWNRYSYSYGNPLNYADPNGLEPIPADLLPIYESYFGRDFSNINLQTGGAGAFVTRNMGNQWGVTFGNQIYLSADAVSGIGDRSPEALAILAHELEHTVQYDALGTRDFFLWYGADIVSNMARGVLSADDIHDRIALEAMANRTESAFLPVVSATTLPTLTWASVETCANYGGCVTTTYWYRAVSFSPALLFSGGTGLQRATSSPYDLFLAGGICIEGICL